MAAWSETFLGPIMARMAEQETTIREQAETIGKLPNSPRCVPKAPPGALNRRNAPDLTTEPSRTWWRRLWPATWMTLALSRTASC